MRRILRFLTDLAVGLGLIGALLALFLFGVLPLLASTLPQGGAGLTIARRVGVILSLFLGYVLYARRYEGRKPSELAPLPVPASVSALSAVGLVLAVILVLYAADAYHIHAYRKLAASAPIIGTIVVAVIVEETIFRGVVFRTLEKQAGSAIAIAVTATAFGGLHVFNDHATASTVVSVTLLGALWTGIYVWYRNLWVAIAHHAAWNISIFVTGSPLSGQEGWRAYAPVESSYSGPNWLTGGSFGPEDSIVSILLTAAAVVTVLRAVRRRGGLRPLPPAAVHVRKRA